VWIVKRLRNMSSPRVSRLDADQMKQLLDSSTPPHKRTTAGFDVRRPRARLAKNPTTTRKSGQHGRLMCKSRTKKRCENRGSTQLQERALKRLENRNRRKIILYRSLTTPGRIRTCDLRIRSPLLYPAELRAHACFYAVLADCESGDSVTTRALRPTMPACYPTSVPARGRPGGRVNPRQCWYEYAV
jgi:hypothetical protein